MPSAERFQDCSRAVDAIIEQTGARISLALPLGLGKPNHLVNALVARAIDGELDQLEIFTALSLGVPGVDHPLERRLMEPIAERIYEGWESLDYVDLRARGELPDNIRIHEFYFSPGEMLGNDRAQQEYKSVNYTDALREILESKPNLVMQLAAPAGDGRLDLSCNTDLTLDLFEAVGNADDRPLFAAQVNRRLPAMGGRAEVATEMFDVVLDDPAYDYELFSLPSLPPGDAEYAIGLRTAALIRDGGTLQVGIGNQGAAVCWAAMLRDQHPETFAHMLDDLGTTAQTRALIERIGGLDSFDEGLYASTEMLVEGILQMYLAGLIRRRVFDDLDAQRRALAGDTPDEAGAAIHAGFFLGSERFYQLLRDLDDHQRDEVRMTSVNFTNLLYGDEELKRAQRRQARFVNQAMNVTLLGAVASDTLPDGQVVSGVGGQYEFVSMAHALGDGRALLTLESTRGAGDQATSNIVWSHEQPTLPRHLRDIVVTEYGVADLRGKSDRGVVEALIEIADSRFQEELAERARAAGKLPRDYRVPEHARQNTPERLSEALAPYRRGGEIP
ncbi:MAG: acetyl-CoA hydrolase/transferase C-terminal domain-containing protein, partial [Persicimonas sp.]